MLDYCVLIHCCVILHGGTVYSIGTCQRFAPHDKINCSGNVWRPGDCFCSLSIAEASIRVGISAFENAIEAL